MILVTGGTGLVGSHLLYFLMKEGKSVRAIHRKSSNFQAVKNVFSYYSESSEELFDRIEWVEADITEVPSLTEAFKDITHVYHAAAYISFNPKDYYKLKKANIEGTANIVNLCLSNNVQKLIHVSSIATLGNESDEILISENSEWNSEFNNSIYAITKYGAEMEVWRGTQEGLDAVIVNPGIIFGSGHWNSGSNLILKAVAQGMPYYSSGTIGIIDVQDVVRAMISLMESPIKNQRFILVSKNLSYRELLSELAKYLQRKPARKNIPKWVLLLLANCDWLSNILFGTTRIFFKSMANSIYIKSCFDSSKIENELNFRFTPYEQTLERVSKNYLKKL